jgi:hypothetical protein
VTHPEEAVWVTFPACDDPARILEPGKQPLDLPPATVASERAAVLRPRPTVRSIGSNQLNPEVIIQMAIERVTVIAAIADQSGRERAEEARRACLATVDRDHRDDDAADRSVRGSAIGRR